MRNLVDQYLTSISDHYGIDSFMLRYAICLLGAFPLNAILKRLPDRRVNLKCWYILTIAVFYICGVLALYSGARTLCISATFTIFLTRFYRSKFMPYLNFILVLGHLAINHMYAQFYTPQNGGLDITSAQMVLCMKLTSFAWAYYDGHYRKSDELTEHERARAIKSNPPLLYFAAYVFFYPTLLTGPSVEYVDFDNWIHGRVFNDLPDSHKPRRRFHPDQRRQIPKNGKLALCKVLQGAAWIIVGSLGLHYFPAAYIWESDDFSSKSMIYKLHYMAIVGFIARMKYYAAWTISEGACILCGLGYNGYDPKTGQIKWNKMQNIDVMSVEFAQSTHQCLEAWNMNTNKWLKYSVYLRAVPLGKKPGFGTTLLTFLTSAFWHGTRAGYYLTFATGALYQTCGKLYRRNLRPIFLAEDGATPLPSKKLYDFLGFYFIKIAFGYLIQPFIFLDLKKSMKAWKSVYFCGHIFIALTFFLFKGPYSRSVINFCRTLQPKEQALIKQKKKANDIIVKSDTLGDILDAKLQYEAATQSNELDIISGIPDLDSYEWNKAKDDWNDFMQEYNDWREHKGLEIEKDNLAKAFQEFRHEVADASQGSAEKLRKRSFSNYSPKPFDSPK